MNKTITSKILPRKPLTNINSFKQQNPVTLSEKLKNVEDKCEALVTDLAELKVELNRTKDELSDAKNEAAKQTKEKDDLSQEIKVIKIELTDAKNEAAKQAKEKSDLSQEIKDIKVELSAAKNEAAKQAKEKDEISQEIKVIKAKISKLNKKIQLEDGIAKSVTTSDSSLPRKIFQNLPCDSEDEMDDLRDHLKRNLDTLLYVVSVMLLYVRFLQFNPTFTLYST